MMMAMIVVSVFAWFTVVLHMSIELVSSFSLSVEFIIIIMTDYQRNREATELSAGKSHRQWKKFGFTVFLFGLADCGIWLVNML